MRLPFAHEEYKDKPVRGAWRHRLLRRRTFWPQRIIYPLVAIVILLWLFSRSSSLWSGAEETEEGSFPWKVDTTRFPAGIKDSLLKAHHTARVKPSIFFLVNGLENRENQLINLACDMANIRNDTHVNVLILGRGSSSMDQFRTVNKLGDCPASFHDARLHSSRDQQDGLYYNYAANTLKHIAESYLPEAFITTDMKPYWFISAFKTSQTTQILLEKVHKVFWMAHLSAQSLHSWNVPRIDLVIDAASHSGSLNRLFRSLSAAEYLGAWPLLMINFDETSTSSARTFAEKLSKIWPQDKLILRRRIEKTEFSLFENWYPTNEDHYALLLSDMHELSVHFYHYLFSMILQHRYDGVSAQKMLGITLTGNDNTKVDSPILLFPNHVIGMHEFYHQRGKLLEEYKRENQLVVLSPPLFSFDDGDFVLCKSYKEDEEDWKTLDQLPPQEAQLLKGTDDWRLS